LCTGWSSRWSDPATFLGLDTDGGKHFPGFGGAATDFLLAERNIAGVGIDTHGVDGGQDTELVVNRRVLEEPRLVLENLTNLDRLPTREVTLVIGILRLRGGAGSPASVLAFVP